VSSLARRRLLVVVAAVAALVASVCAGAHATSSAPVQGELLPDLDQETPNQLLIAHVGEHWLLGFQSAVRNIGAGPLLINGQRASRATPFMQADQQVMKQDGTSDVDRNVGRLRYVRSPDHQHWHLLRFERYELRRAGSRKVLIRDRKTGFCLGDRYRVINHKTPGALATPLRTGRCALRQPGRLTVSEGISVGWGDNYVAYLEGQSLPIDHLASGRYVLVHRVNTDHRLRELSYTNDASSVLLDLRWRNGKPHLTELATCPDSARCDSPSVPTAAKRVPRGQVSANWRHLGLIAGTTMLCSLTHGYTQTP
jgi:Lysyl oxidase